MSGPAEEIKCIEVRELAISKSTSDKASGPSWRSVRNAGKQQGSQGCSG